MNITYTEITNPVIDNFTAGLVLLLQYDGGALIWAHEGRIVISPVSVCAYHQEELLDMNWHEESEGWVFYVS